MRPNLNAPLTGAPVVQTTTTTVVKETVKVDEYRDETDFYYTKERLSYIGLIRNLGFLALAVSIASLVLASIHLANHKLDFAKILVAACCLFLLGSVLAIYWSTRAAKAFKASHDLFQPQVTEGLSRIVFISALVLAGFAAFTLTHLLVEQEYSPDYAKAQDTSPAIWDEEYEGRTLEGVINYFRKHFIIQGALIGFLFFYFLLVARAAFSCLKFGNQAMSHLVFLGSFLLLVFSLCLIFFADYAFEYSEYPQLRAHFPVWNIRGLYFVGIALTAIAVTGFLVDHRSWRVGFFVLAFLLLVLMAILATFTGFAYRHTRQTYQYYKGDECLARMDLVHSNEIEDYGCPTKYVANDQCTNPIYKWEQTGADSNDLTPRTDSIPEPELGTGAAARQATQNAAIEAANAAAQQAAAAEAQQQAAQQAADAAAAQQAAAAAAQADAAQQTQQANAAAAAADQQQATANEQQAAADAAAANADQQQAAADQQNAAGDAVVTDAAPSTMMAFSDNSFMTLAEYGTPTYCLNKKCCGIQGQLYSKHLIQLAAFGLLSTLAAALVSIGCYYFWYVTWVDSARDKRRDFVWLGLMGLSILVFIVLFFALDRSYIAEKTGDGPRQLEMW